MIAPRTRASNDRHQVLKQQMIAAERLHEEMRDRRIRLLLEAKLNELKEQAAAFDR